MVLIDLKRTLTNHNTNADGERLLTMIVENFEKGNTVEISFEDIDAVNSSFVNSAFIGLLDYYDFSVIRKKLSFVKTNKQINLLILSRFKFEVEKKQVVNLNKVVSV